MLNPLNLNAALDWQKFKRSTSYVLTGRRTFKNSQDSSWPSILGSFKAVQGWTNLSLNFLSAGSLQLKWMKEGRKGSVINVMRSGSLDISNGRATNSLKTFARVSP